MQFEWDEAKNQINIRKHGIDFQDAIDVFNHPVLTSLDTREDYGEDRVDRIGLDGGCRGRGGVRGAQCGCDPDHFGPQGNHARTRTLQAAHLELTGRVAIEASEQR